MEVKMIQELARIDDNKEILDIEQKLAKKEGSLKYAMNSDNKEMLEETINSIKDLLNKELSLEEENPALDKLIQERYDAFSLADGDFTSRYFEVLKTFDSRDLNINKDKLLDKDALDIKDVSFEGIKVDDESFSLLKEELAKKGIALQNSIKVEGHITQNYLNTKDPEHIYTNDDLGKECDIKISHYGENLKDVTLEDGTKREDVVANQGVLVESINGENVPENTHITLSRNPNKMIVTINEKEKKVPIGKAEETKDCNFDTEFEYILKGKTAVFDKDSNAFYKTEDKEKIVDDEIKKQIEDTVKKEFDYDLDKEDMEL